MLQKTAGQPVNFKEMAETLRDVISANIFIVSRRGKLLGFAIKQEIDNERMKKNVGRPTVSRRIHKKSI